MNCIFELYLYRDKLLRDVVLAIMQSIHFFKDKNQFHYSDIIVTFGLT
jgi:hypothetical protein